jgi:hypothetical protein
MYLPLVKAFNYALDRLSGFDVPGLLEFQEKHQIVFACSSRGASSPSPTSKAHTSQTSFWSNGTRSNGYMDATMLSTQILRIEHMFRI